MRRHARADSTARPDTPRALDLCASVVVAIALVCGGGTGRWLWGDLLAELAGLGLLAVMVIWRPAPAYRADRWGVVLLACIVALPLLQLVPLPPAIWTELAGRADVASALRVVGSSMPTEPVSLAPGNTLGGVLFLLPAAALFLAAARGREWFDRLVGFTILAALGVSLLLDLAQIVQGPGSDLRFFAETNRSDAVGFFANRNHNAAFVYAAALLCFPAFASRGKRGVAAAIPVVALLCLMFTAVFLTGSRAGLIFAFIAGVVIVSGARSWRSSTRRLSIVVPVLLAAFVAVALGAGALDRFSARDITSDARWTIARVTLDGLRAYLPVGSGFGSFEATYLAFETPDAVQAALVNHAHDDWLELVYEGGVPALFLMLAFLVWFGMRAVAKLRDADSDRLRTICALSTVVLLLLHSTVDYPLRTIAVSCLFGVACGILARGRRPAGASSPERTR